ncbi:MAG: TonB-dependent receptor, partial [bacterium]|nr:TonB-dependent receptor [bacterium]
GLGLPSTYMKALGNVHRGFRNWFTRFYMGDDWRVTPRLTLNLGLRYEPVTKPSEVNGLSEVPYSSDLNNLAPRVGFAYRLPGSWGVMRAAYGLHYGEIFPATFMQSRFNPPGNLLVRVDEPDLVDPLGGLSEADLRGDGRSTLFQVARDLSTPYSHQYNFSWELSLPADWTLELGYVGSRSHRLLTMFYLNRARVVPGVDQTSRTINARRPDQRYFDVLHIHNGSRGYFDAAKVMLRVPRWKGFSIDGSYWFSKAMDLGASYTGTASGRDGRSTRSPSEFGFQAEMRGFSRFDQPHATLWRVNYETPALAGQGRWLRGVLGGWQVSSVVLVKSGTPFSVQAGSDSPGFGNVDGASSDNPILLDPSVLGRSIDHPDTSAGRLPRSAFATIQPTDLRG